MRKTAALVSAAALALTLAACSDSGKPSKDEVVTALTDIAVESFGEDTALVGEDVLREYSTCWVDGFYDDVSADTLNSLVEQKNDENVSEEEASTILDAATECQSVLMDAVVGETGN